MRPTRTIRSLVALGTASAALAVAPASARAQRATRAGVAPAPEGGAERTARAIRVPLVEDARRGRRSASWWAPLASVVVPGAGQALLGQSRAAGYAALDAYTWLQYRELARDARRQRAEYRQIARDVARRPCVASCPDGDWDYYETLEKRQYVGSGAYDAGMGGVFVPERRDSTYNGAIWQRALDLYWRRPGEPAPTETAYRNALAYYQQHAYRPELAWSWRDQQLAFGEYRATIARFNRTTRNMNTALSVAIANRVLSLVDAYVTVRVRRFGGADGPTELSATVPFGRLPSRGRR